ncbi:hypothetical protein [Bacillus sp. 204(2023)]
MRSLFNHFTVFNTQKTPATGVLYASKTIGCNVIISSIALIGI